MKSPGSRLNRGDSEPSPAREGSPKTGGWWMQNHWFLPELHDFGTWPAIGLIGTHKQWWFTA